MLRFAPVRADAASDASSGGSRLEAPSSTRVGALVPRRDVTVGADDADTATVDDADDAIDAGTAVAETCAADIKPVDNAAWISRFLGGDGGSRNLPGPAAGTAATNERVGLADAVDTRASASAATAA